MADLADAVQIINARLSFLSRHSRDGMTGEANTEGPDEVASECCSKTFKIFSGHVLLVDQSREVVAFRAVDDELMAPGWQPEPARALATRSQSLCDRLDFPPSIGADSVSAAADGQGKAPMQIGFAATPSHPIVHHFHSEGNAVYRGNLHWLPRKK
ncbi:MAG: hypothetical protein Q9219_001687 [cf. Caloplaca sp. 3 TL-2023]